MLALFTGHFFYSLVVWCCCWQAWSGATSCRSFDPSDYPKHETRPVIEITWAQAHQACGVKGFPTLMLETPDSQKFIDINPNDPQYVLNQMGVR